MHILPQEIPELVHHNQSRIWRGVLRGLHYQLVPPYGKLVRCARGQVFDVAVDVRRGDPTFGQSMGGAAGLCPWLFGAE
jgi:dTDP-4-dehydrorhamnose 3,5-epimerase